ncbi:VOC family protein [Bacillus sp. J33]|uniref:VOC family protein n=1 Tax=Bacillus sp. J33 TaxID=935836 RepID=UPI00047C204B|nr:VOC family protein [Bacillus sp. J33]
MEIKLDHIVHFVNGHPSEAVIAWKSHGFNAVMGGSHEKWGTYNSLLYIGHSYLEFLSIEAAKIAFQSDNPLIRQLAQELQKGEGIGQICFRTDNILQLKKDLEDKGCETYPIFHGSRKRKDGSIIKWKMLFIKDNPDYKYPFFIDWEKEDEIRFQELKQLGLLDKRLENARIHSIYIASEDSEKTAKEWTKLFPFIIKGTSGTVEQAERRTAIFAGSAQIIFCQPLTESSLAAAVLKTRGEKPFKIQIAPSLENELNIFGSNYS